MSKLTSRQQNVRNLVHSAISVYDVCGIVAEYVFAGVFKMKMVRHSRSRGCVIRYQKAIGTVMNSHVLILEDSLFDLRTGKVSLFADSPFGEMIHFRRLLGLVEGNMWYLYRDFETTILRFQGTNLSNELPPLKAQWIDAFTFPVLKLIGCVDQYAFFTTDRSIIKVSKETGTKILEVQVISTGSMVVSHDQRVIYWKAINSFASQLCSIDMSGQSRPEMITDLSISAGRYSLNFFSGDDEDEIWSFASHEKSTLVFSSSTLKLLRLVEWNPNLIYASNLTFSDIDNTLYAYKQDYSQTYTDVWVFE